MATFPNGCTLLFGGSGGIGRGVAKTFADAGSDIAVAYRSKPDVAEEVAAYARNAGRRASTHQADVTDPEAVKAAVAAAIAEHGRIHSVVWGAGPLVNQRYLAETPMNEWRHAFEVEVHGFFSVMREVIPHMRENGGGSFVTLGSAGHDWWPARDGMSVAVKAANPSISSISTQTTRRLRTICRASLTKIAGSQLASKMAESRDTGTPSRWLSQ